MPEIISNSSPIIHLAKLGMLNLRLEVELPELRLSTKTEALASENYYWNSLIIRQHREVYQEKPHVRHRFSETTAY